MITGTTTRIIQTDTVGRISMSDRSGLVSIALVFVPNLIIFTFRILSPDLNEAMANDNFIQVSIHLIGLLIGLFAMFKYMSVYDHEYRRSKAIKGLSRTYRMEDKGLWEKGEIAIQKLEATAYSDSKGKKGKILRRRMQGKIGEINREEGELTEDTIIENNDYPIQVDGHQKEQSSKLFETKETIPMLTKIYKFFSDSIEKSASRRIELQKNKQQSSIRSTSNETYSDSKWSVADSRSLHAKLCNHCSTYNEADSNYCNSCGAYIS